MSSVTVIIPTYRRPAQLRVAVQSVLDQALGPDEILVVDDASPGGGLVDLPDDERIRWLRREVNGGVSAAQNTGLAQATGTYVCFLHSDDEMLPGKLALQVPVLDDAGGDVAAVESASIRETADGTTVLPPRHRATSADAVLRREVPNVHISPFLFRRSALEEVGGFDEALRAYEDFDLFVRLRRRYEFAYIDEPTVTLHQHGDDRLAESPWMQAGRESLLAKYDEELRRFDRLPPRWQEWEVGAGIAALDRGERAVARRHFTASARGDRRAMVRRLPLVAATWVPGAAGRAVAGAYRSGSRKVRQSPPR